MSTSLYDLTIPVLIRAMGALGRILEKGRAHAEAEGIDPEDLLQARLFPDMATLIGQVQRASDTAKGAAVRLGQIPNVRFEDDETSFDGLQARVAATLEFLKAAPREAIDGREDAEVVLQTPNAAIPFTGRGYALDYVLPNVFFHVTTAYGLLRHKGVPLGKLDYLGRR